MKLPGSLNLTAYRGDTFDLVITFTKNDAPHNLTGTAKMKLYKHNAKDPYAEYNLTITDNILSYSFTVANVLSFAMSGRYDITFSENANVKTKIRGSLTVENVQTSGSVVSGATVTLTETNLIAQVTEGIPGPKGADGITPEIGQNGNWFIVVLISFGKGTRSIHRKRIAFRAGNTFGYLCNKIRLGQGYCRTAHHASRSLHVLNFE